MNDNISRKAAVDEIRKCRFVVDAIEKIRGLPSTDRSGHWIRFDEQPWDVRECSECGTEGAPYWDFCPHCGARMK